MEDSLGEAKHCYMSADFEITIFLFMLCITSISIETERQTDKSINKQTARYTDTYTDRKLNTEAKYIYEFVHFEKKKNLRFFLMH